jgi:hypothetical protein
VSKAKSLTGRGNELPSPATYGMNLEICFSGLLVDGNFEEPDQQERWAKDKREEV